MARNPIRGEVAFATGPAKPLVNLPVVLDGHTWYLRPTFEAMIEIETGTGIKIVPLAQAVARKEFGANDICVILAAGIRASGQNGVTAEKVGRVIERVGLLDPGMIQTITNFLSACLSGGATKESVSGEAAAVGESQASTSPTADTSDTH